MLYPATPQPVNEEITHPSAEFRKEVRNVLLAIVIFLLVYIVLLVLSVLLVIGCFYAGIMILTAGFSFLTLLGGLGLMGVGAMVFIFMIKFLFSYTKTDRSAYIEITEQEQPKLFAFVRQLTADVRTPFPKKIYLSTDVNAAVFYDSGFWSMFFPVRKNLLIGLGLVNMVNMSEFKAVMAHEFGHFSQRSMKLGSYVYQVNRIIYNMLYDNSSYTAFLQGWAEVHGIFALFAMLTANIARLIQWILRQMYGLINKSYFGLSRQMEFHADAVAAAVSGSDHLVSALRGLELAEAGYSITLQKCDELLRDKKILSNLFPGHSAVIRQLAAEYKLPLVNNQPVINDEAIEKNSVSRVNFKDQWASHPSTPDRVIHLRKLNIPAVSMVESAWMLFDHRETLEKAGTAKVYGQSGIQDSMELVDEVYFEEKLKRERQLGYLPEVYNGFYDDRQLSKPDWTGLKDTMADLPANREMIFSDTNAGITRKIQGLAQDIELVKAIADKRIDTKTFDFDGKKYKRADAGELAKELEMEIEQQRAAQLLADKQALAYFIQAAGKNGHEEQLKHIYDDYFSRQEKADALLQSIQKIGELLQPLFTGGTLTLEQVQSMIRQLTGTLEPSFKAGLESWLSAGAFDGQTTLREQVTQYLAASYAYFHENSFFENEILELNTLLTNSWEAVSRFQFLQFKKLLEQQWELAGQ